MAYKDKGSHRAVQIPVNLLQEVDRLPLPYKTAPRNIAYLLRLGVRYHVILEKAAAEAGES